MLSLNQVTIPVTDLDRSVAFYEALGLRLIVKAPHYARFECPAGDATFSLHRAEKLPVDDSGVWLCFETAALDTFVDELISKGIAPEEMPEDKPWLWREARLKDPDGHQLILYFAGNNRKDPPWKIKR